MDNSRNIKYLTVFNKPSKDSVLKKLNKSLNCASAQVEYASLCRKLYKRAGGDLSQYVLQLVKSDDNVYLEKTSKGEKIPQCLEDAMQSDLKILQSIADTTCDEISSYQAWGENAPRFETSSVDIKSTFDAMTENVKTRGFGIWAQSIMFELDNSTGQIVPVKHADTTSLANLFDYNRERQIVIDNTLAFLDNKPAQNVLLTGDAGTGKSSTIKAVVNEYASRGLRVIEIKKSQIASISRVIAETEDSPLHFIIFIDDISFSSDDDTFGQMKALLEGSLSAQSNNVLIYATSNRRHIVKEKFSDRDGDEIHVNDSIQEMVSLSERFGIHVTFSRPSKRTYLGIVRDLAVKAGISIPQSELELEAERFATQKGGRSGRTAKQFVEMLAAKE